LGLALHGDAARFEERKSRREAERMNGTTELAIPPSTPIRRETGFRKRNLASRLNVPLGTVIGVPISLDYSWFLVFALLTWMLAGSYYPSEFPNWSPPLYWFMGAITAILLFGSVLVHELGHAVVALRCNVPVRSITLFIFGGVAQLGAEPPSAKAEFLIAIAGPAVSLILAAIFFVVQPAVASIEPLWGLVKYLAFINFALVAFNLIPGFPLDGGRVFRAFVWSVTKSFRQSTIIAANVGRFFGFLFIFFGVWRLFSGDFGGLWIAFIGWFLENAATAQVNQTAFQGLLHGHSVSQAMSRHCVAVSSDLSIEKVVEDYVLNSGRRCFLVNRGADTIGLITLHRIKEVSRSDWDKTTVAQAMIPIEELKQIGPTTDLSAALLLMDRDGVNQLPVMIGGKVDGMLSRDDVVSYLRTLHEVGV